MKAILATGIYPPEIGGPATYVRALARELVRLGHEVVVIAYGTPEHGEGFGVYGVSRSLPIVRWFAYARALRKYGRDADAVIAFSSVSVGIPLILAFLKKPKCILRLGGDFFWERYTDRGKMMPLHEWYAKKEEPLRQWVMSKLLRAFGVVVFSTDFQKEIYEKYYRKLPEHSVIENALPGHLPTLIGKTRMKHNPFRLLFMGRFVCFKNLPALVQAVNQMDGVALTLIGAGPMESVLRGMAGNSVTFLPPAHGEDTLRVFAEHDLLVIPSITEISPNVALEASSAGLPVLLSDQTGLSKSLTGSMHVCNLSTPQRIKDAIADVIHNRYETMAHDTAHQSFERGWDQVAHEWVELLPST